MKLKIENYKTHQMKVLPLEKLNFLNGKSGSGKSSVIESLYFLLLGEIPGVGKRSEDLLKASSGNFINVALKNDNDRVYERKVEKGSNPKLFIEGKQESALDFQVDKELLNFYNYLDMSPKEKNEYLMNLLGGNTEITGSELLGEVHTIPSNDSDKELFKSICSLKGNYQTVMDDAVKLLEEERKIGKKRLKEAENAYSSVTDTRSFYDLSENQLKEKKEELTALIEQRINLEKKLSETARSGEMAEANLQKKRKLTDALKKYESSFQEKSTSFKKLKFVENLDAGLRSEELTIQEIQSNITTLEEERATVIQKGQLIKQSNKKMEENILILSKDDKSCPLNPNVKCSTTFQGEIQKMKEDLKKLTTERVAMVTTYKNLTGKLEALKLEIDRHKEVLRSLEKSKFENIEYKNLAESLKQLQTLMKDTKAELESIPSTTGDTGLELITLKAERDLLLKNIKALQEELEAGDKILTKSALQQEWTRTITLQKTSLTFIESFLSTVKSEGKSFISKKIEHLSSQIKEELKELSFNGFFSFKEDSKTISIGVERNGQFIDYAMLSKGEKLLFAVAIMTAFYKENKNSSFKVLVIDNVLDIGEKRLTELTEYITKNQEHYDIVLIAGIVEEKINKKFKVINFSEVKEQMSLLEGVV